ncbi:MAG: hypothetical protein E6G87_01190 [Alphaproteobacteria bacterium]|nr:MAG: hypothetical protein E6G87_01190 [Alphaproteobacteria bacterium]
MNETEPSKQPLRKPEVQEAPKPSVGEAMPGVLQYGGGAGRFEGMEARIASLEAHVDHIRDDIGDMRLDLKEVAKTMGTAGAEMREFDSRINSLPTKGWMMATLLILAAIIFAVAIYLEQIRHYLGVIPPPTSL